MNASHQKTLRDLSLEGTRTVLAVFATAIGIAGFLAVLSAYAILTRELNRGYLATNPASATLHVDSVDDGLLAAVIANPAIAAADARRNVAGRIKTGPGDWHTLKLFVMKDFAGMRIGKLDPELGSWPPSTGEILIERDALGIAKVRIGDTVTVKTVGGSEQPLRVSGSVHDVGQAQARMENTVYGYVTLDTLARLGEAPYLDRLNILVAANRRDQKHIGRVAGEIAKLTESRGHAVSRVDVPTPGEHPHAHIMGLLLLVMASFGFCILALSGILVINLVTAMMASQVRQIGVMKAIGASRGQITSIYLSQTVLLGTAAILVALPLGIAGGRQLCRVMAGLLNFDIASFAAPAWVYLLAAAAGWAVPLLAAAFPVWKVTRIPVRLALARSEAGSDGFGTSGFDRILAGLGGPLRPLLFAVRNNFRRRTRLALTLATLVAGGLFFLVGLNVRTSMIHTFDGFFAARKFDLSASLSTMAPLERVERAIRSTPGVTRAEEWIITEAAIPPQGNHFTIIGRPPKTALLRLEMVEGRDLLPGDTNAIVLNIALATEAHSSIGKTFTLRLGQADASLRIVGIARERFSPPTGYIPREYASQLGGYAGKTNSIRMALDDTSHASIENGKTALDKNLEREHLRAESMADTAGIRFAFDQHMLMIYVFLVAVSSIIAAIGGLGLMTTMSLNVLERRREMGVLRAIGASPSVVGLIIVTEGVVVALLGWALAALTALPLSKLLGDFLWKSVFTTGMDFRFEPSAFVIWLAVSIVLGIISSLLPAWNASRTTVREALSHE